MLNLNHNRITKVLTAALLTVASTNALAATAPSTATVTVQNTFTLTETTPLTFGTVRAAPQADGAAVAELVLNPDSSSSVVLAGTATMTQLSAGTAGQFTVTDAAPFTDLTITFPADFTMAPATGLPSGAPVFEVLFADWTATISGGANDGAAYTGGDLQTDGTGTVSFFAGTSLKTDSAVTTSGYLDTDYVANYTMTVDY